MRIDDRHQSRNGRQIRQHCVAHLNPLLNAGRNGRQLRLLTVIDQGVMNLLVIKKEIEQVQCPARQRGIDDHQIKWLATVFDQGQQLFKTVHRCYPVVVELIEQSLDLHAMKMQLVGDQDT